MRLVNYLADEFQKEQGINLRNDKLALQRLKEAAEKAKIELSSTTQTEINLPFITADQTGPKHLTMKLTRAKFEALVDDLVQKTIEPCRKALKDAGLTAAEIGEVVLVGGMQPVDIAPKDRLIVALDLPGVAEAEAMIARLGDSVSFYKIGYQLGYAGGLPLVQQLAKSGKKVFVDLKLHDIGNTVARGVESVAKLGATFLTVHVRLKPPDFRRT